MDEKITITISKNLFFEMMNALLWSDALESQFGNSKYNEVDWETVMVIGTDYKRDFILDWTQSWTDQFVPVVEKIIEEKLYENWM